jgi:V/A-type H+-transporting ATPase subunit E
MDVQLDGLIEKLKKEGIDEGRTKAAEIVREAEKKAAAILDDAAKKSGQIVADAQKQAAQFQTNGKLALKQAARDGELLLKSRITELFDRVFKQRISETLTADFLKEMILKLVDQWGKGTATEIVLSATDRKKLEDVLFQGVGKALRETVTLRPSPEISGGFRIGLKGQDVYYDFTDESIAETLKLFLKPNLKEILDGGKHG